MKLLFEEKLQIIFELFIFSRKSFLYYAYIEKYMISPKRLFITMSFGGIKKPFTDINSNNCFLFGKVYGDHKKGCLNPFEGIMR